MSLKIDPNKVHLGDTQHKFYAEYFPAYSTQDEKPLDCVLPPLTSLSLTPVEFTPIQEVCVFTFPEVTPIPPVYNPPVIPGGCADFTATSNFNILSPLTGGLTLDASGPPDCGIVVGGNIGLPPGFCEEIITTVDITGKGKNPPTLDLTFTNSGPPDCELTLAGDITVDACKDFVINTGTITAGGTNPPTVALTLTASPAPNCGVSLSGSIDVDACKNFTAQSTASITTSRTAVTSGSLSLTPTSAPNCGVTLGGAVVLKACDSISITTETTDPAKVTIKKGLVTAGTINLGGSVTITPGVDDCSKKFKLDLTPKDLTITLPAQAVSSAARAGLYIQTNADDVLSLGGTLTTSCTPSPGPKDLILDSLKVNYISPPPMPCCSNEDPFLDLCGSKLYLQKDSKYMSLATDDLRENDVARFRPVTATVNGIEDTIYVLATGGNGDGGDSVTIAATGGGGGEIVPCHFRVTDATVVAGYCQVKVEYGTVSTTQGHRAPLGMFLGTDYILEISQSCHIYVAMLFDTTTMALNQYDTAISLLQSNTLMTNTTSMQYERIASIVVDPGSDTVPAKITDIINRCAEIYPNACNLDWSTV